ncbi:MAG TPA: hypothetical protein VMV20_07180 [Chitinophagaceae bacterium]|nr:hypothetical protein [Chitinophagaceae bacterium]
MKKILGLLTVAALFAGTSCTKPNSKGGQPLESDSTFNAANTAAQVELFYDDPLNILLQLSSGSDSSSFYRTSSGLVSACTNITVLPADTTTYPKTVTMDFGNGCVGPDGRERSGKVVAVLSGKLNIPGSTMNINLNNFAIGGIRVSGSRLLTNVSMNDTMRLTSVIHNGVVSQLTRLDLGYSDSLFLKEIPEAAGDPPTFTIGGTASLNLGYGNPVLIQITQPLVKVITCKYFISGQFGIHQDAKSATVDFGPGLCTGVITINVNGQSGQTTLPD